jgi:hypothetical protein
VQWGVSTQSVPRAELANRGDEDRHESSPERNGVAVATLRVRVDLVSKQLEHFVHPVSELGCRARVECSTRVPSYRVSVECKYVREVREHCKAKKLKMHWHKQKEKKRIAKDRKRKKTKKNRHQQT